MYGRGASSSAVGVGGAVGGGPSGDAMARVDVERAHQRTRLRFKRRLQRGQGSAEEDSGGGEGREEEVEEEGRRRGGEGDAGLQQLIPAVSAAVDLPLPLPSAFLSPSPSSPSPSPSPSFAPLGSRLLRLSTKRVDAFTALMAHRGDGGGQHSGRQQTKRSSSRPLHRRPTPSTHPTASAAALSSSSSPSSSSTLPSAPVSSSSSLSSLPRLSSSLPCASSVAVQLHLDFGQSLAGLTQCSVCLCTYHAGQAEDERLHAQQHRQHTQGPPFNGWKDECLVQPGGGGSGGGGGAAAPLPLGHRVLCVRPSALTRHRPSRSAKVQQILDLLHMHLGEPAQEHLGLHPTSPSLPMREGGHDDDALLPPTDSSSTSPPSPSSSVCPLSADHCLYLYVVHRRVVGVLLVRCSVPCSQLLRVKREEGEGGGSEGKEDANGVDGAARGGCSWQLSLCPTDRCVAPMGVERVWVVPAWRRRGVGRVMLDASRYSLLYGEVVQREDVAFSQPTEDGRRFAQAYTGLQFIRAYVT